MTPGSARSIAVAVATYRRPDGLAALLHSLAAMTDAPPFDVIVVDNDPAGSAAAVYSAIAPSLPFRLLHVHEPTPGIAAARNAALDTAADHEWICFVDDDEVVDPHWLRGLVTARERSGSDAATGPVEFRFAQTPPRWALLGNFYIRPEFATGDRCDIAATNNLLMSMAALRARGLRFDAAFGTTGGSDIMLTRQFTASGGTIVWTEDAIVSELVPAARCTAGWLVRRAVRSGNTSALVDLALRADEGRVVRGAHRARVAAGGVARVLVGAVRIASAPRINRQRRGAAGLRTLLRGVGVLTACASRPIHEYGR